MRREMKVLEKIIEEIEDVRKIMKSTVATNCFGKECENDDCTVCVCERVIEIIRSHMNDATDTNVPSNWIPVEERLPEEDSFEYIISCSDGITRTGVSYGYAKDEDKEPCFYKYDDEYWNCYRYNNVVAWQPLPEPYKGANYNG